MPEFQPEHQPVLVAELLELLAPQPGMIVLDGTVGLGGHARALIERILPGGRYLGLDVDAEMLEVARRRLSAFEAPSLQLSHMNYADFPRALDSANVQQVDLMLLDLGANSAHFDDPSRGFSFDQEGPLDMRFDRQQSRQAADLINRLSETELADLFYHFGQETMSRRIAKRICQARHTARIKTTRVLARTIEAAAPRSGPGRIHPATRVFQALRVAVNAEFDNLEKFLQAAPPRLRAGGKLAIISFHSLEDGIVKRAFREARQAGLLEEITKRPVIAGQAEREQNPRARSAKLRVARRIDSN